MVEVSEKTYGRMRPGIKILLVVSLALNLLVIGLIGGALVMRGKWQEHHMSRMEMIGGPLTRALDRADRRAIGRAMRESFGDRQARHDKMRAEFETIVAELKAVPFDVGTVANQMAAHRKHFNARMEQGQALLLQRLSMMDDAERAAFAERLQSGVHHGWRGRYKHH